jgi:S-adenosylmethionine decarboxylase proenzyme
VEALVDTRVLMSTLLRAVEMAGATVVGRAEHTFESGGFTAVVLLSESHASIHTYPEYRACFVDLFTCGDSCLAEQFDVVMREYLSPADAKRRVVLRSSEMRDDVFRAEAVEAAHATDR